MAKSFNTTSRRVEKGEESGLPAVLRRLFRRRPQQSGISHLSDRMLRDIGLGDAARSEYRKIERLRRP
jgi:hypothetical protein